MTRQSAVWERLPHGASERVGRGAWLGMPGTHQTFTIVSCTTAVAMQAVG